MKVDDVLVYLNLLLCVTLKIFIEPKYIQSSVWYQLTLSFYLSNSFIKVKYAIKYGHFLKSREAILGHDEVLTELGFQKMKSRASSI